MIFVLIFTVLACSHSQEVQQETVLLSRVDVDINKAVVNQDFRLYATSGRRTTFPGINNEQLIFVTNVCGKKYFPDTGDVIHSEQQRKQRKNNIAYMQVFNEKMLLLCRKNNH